MKKSPVNGPLGIVCSSVFSVTSVGEETVHMMFIDKRKQKGRKRKRKMETVSAHRKQHMSIIEKILTKTAVNQISNRRACRFDGYVIRGTLVSIN